MEITLDTTRSIKGLDKLSDKLTDMTPLFRNIAGLLADITEDAFDHEMDPSTHEIWKDLSPRTIKERKAKGYWPGKKLVQTNILFSSITPSSGNDFAQIGTNEDYAADLHFGNKEKNLEARPFLGYSPDNAEEIEQMISDFLSN